VDRDPLSSIRQNDLGVLRGMLADRGSPSRQYGPGRCANCERPLSRYNPLDCCSSCVASGVQAGERTLVKP